MAQSVQQMLRVTSCNILCCVSSRKIKLSGQARFMRASFLRSCQKGQMPATFCLWLLPRQSNRLTVITVRRWHCLLLPRVSVVSCQKVIGPRSGSMSCFPYTTRLSHLWSFVLRLVVVVVSSVVRSSWDQLYILRILSCILKSLISFVQGYKKKLSFWLNPLAHWSFQLSKSHGSDPMYRVYPLSYIINFPWMLNFRRS